MSDGFTEVKGRDPVLLLDLIDDGALIVNRLVEMSTPISSVQ
jgi:hypothetical protein